MAYEHRLGARRTGLSAAFGRDAQTSRDVTGGRRHYVSVGFGAGRGSTFRGTSEPRIGTGTLLTIATTTTVFVLCVLGCFVEYGLSWKSPASMDSGRPFDGPARRRPRPRRQLQCAIPRFAGCSSLTGWQASRLGGTHGEAPKAENRRARPRLVGPPWRVERRGREAANLA